MEEGVPIRAIMIGASVIIICGVFGLVMSYYNKAREEAGSANTDMMIETMYAGDIEASFISAKKDNVPLNGIQVKNMLNYYYKSNKVTINLIGYKLISTGRVYSETVPHVNSGNFPTDADLTRYNNIIYNLDPNSKYTLGVSESEDKLYVTYTLTYVR